MHILCRIQRLYVVEVRMLWGSRSRLASGIPCRLSVTVRSTGLRDSEIGKDYEKHMFNHVGRLRGHVTLESSISKCIRENKLSVTIYKSRQNAQLNLFRISKGPEHRWPADSKPAADRKWENPMPCTRFQAQYGLLLPHHVLHPAISFGEHTQSRPGQEKKTVLHIGVGPEHPRKNFA